MDGKICQNIKPPTLTHFFLSTTKHLGKIRRLGYKQFLYFLLYVNSLKKFFKKMSIFSYSLLPKIFKLKRSSLRLVFLIKIVYNIVRTPSPFLKRGEVNFDYLPWSGESEKLEKRDGSIEHGQVLLKKAWGG